MGRITEISDGQLNIGRGNSSVNEFVLIVMRVHLFPFRTQKLSSCTPTIVAGGLAVKIGNANIRTKLRLGSFSYIFPWFFTFSAEKMRNKFQKDYCKKGKPML